MEPQRTGPSNCLAKTQVYAKPKGEVYGLTPARCWKVKRRGYGDYGYLIKIDCDKILSKIINDNLYGDGMVSHLYFANID